MAQIALHQLDMVAIEHKRDIRFSDLGNNCTRLICRFEEIARRVIMIERLDQDRNTMQVCSITGITKVGDKGIMRGRPAGQSGHNVDATGVDRDGVLHSLIKSGARLFEAIG